MSFSPYDTETQLAQANSTIKILHSQLAEEQKQLAEYKQRAEAAEAKLRELEMQEPIGEVIAADTPSINWMISWKPGKRPKTGDKLYAKPFPAPKQEEK